MRITNETYMCCSACGVEASGLDDINQVFGYKIVKEDIKPFSKCRKCRGEEPDFEEHCKKNIKISSGLPQLVGADELISVEQFLTAILLILVT